MSETIIIGSGLAGFSAAIQTSARGHAARILRAGSGASSVSSGAWSFGHIAGSYSFGEHWSAPQTRKILQSILADGLGQASSEQIMIECEKVASALNSEIDIEFRWQKPFQLPTTFGEWRSTYAAQAIQSRCTLDNLEGKNTILIGNPRWRFQHHEVAKSLSKRIPIQAADIDFPKQGHDWPIPRLFVLLENKEARKSFADELERIKKKSGADFLLFPPLLSEEARRDLEKLLGSSFGECLATVEPCAGFRLQRAVENTLAKKNIPVQTVHRATVKTAEKRATRLLAASDDKPFDIPIEKLILATGRLFGGGVHLGYDTLRETICDLPLFTDRTDFSPVKHRSELDWTPVEFTKAQSWAKVGLWVDEKWRPKNAPGSFALSNVRACGTLIGGIDWAHSGMGLGLAAASGGLCADA